MSVEMYAMRQRVYRIHGEIIQPSFYRQYSMQLCKSIQSIQRCILCMKSILCMNSMECMNSIPCMNSMKSMIMGVNYFA